MSNEETLRAMLQDVGISGKLDRNQMLAVLSILINMTERLDKVERVCKIEQPG